MKRVLLKLKDTKKAVRDLRSRVGNLEARALNLKIELERAQCSCDVDPFNEDIREEIAHLLLAYQQVRRDQEEQAKQRAKVTWLSEGDSNTKFFFHTLREKRNQKRIVSVSDVAGTVFVDDEIPNVFVQYFSSILGVCDDTVHPSMNDYVFERKLILSEALHLIRPITDEELKSAMFSIGNDKAPGSDGFSSKFYKAAWPIVGRDVQIALHNFFYSGRLEYQVNHTLPCLIPKVPNANKVTDFRPIACCNCVV